MKIVWVCPHCNCVSVSDSAYHHQMDICKCGKSGVDLEEYLCRYMGEPFPEILAIYDKNKWTRKFPKKNGN